VSSGSKDRIWVRWLYELYEDRIKVGKLNVDENPSIASQYGIRAIPPVLFFKNGEVVDQVVGGVSKRVLENEAEKVLNE